MSTTTPQATGHGTPWTSPGPPRSRSGRLTKVELRKTYDTRAGIWLLGITAFLAVAVDGDRADRRARPGRDDQAGTTSSRIANFISGFLLPVLGIMLVTSEWSQRTAMVTFTLEAHRGRVVTAKLVAGLLLALIVSLIATVSAFLVNGVYAVAHGGARLALPLPRCSSGSCSRR